jgi:type VI secretion system protein VasJ
VDAALIELGSKPIRPDAPGGDPVRDDAEFAELHNEVRKLELPERPDVDWDAVVRHGTAILSGRSKDMLVAAYLNLGLLERRGFEGLADGLTLMRDLIANFWEQMYPEVKRARGRLAAFEWLSERTGAAVARLGEKPVQEKLVETCLERVGEIADLLSEKLEGSSGVLADLRSALNGVEVRSAAPPPSAAASPSAAAPAAPRSAAAPAAAAGPASVSDDATADQALNEAKRLMRAAGEYYRTKDPKDPFGYRLPRLAAWLTLRQAPPSAPDGKTQIPPPQPPDLPARLEAMLANAQFPGILQEVEGRIGSSVMWLDLHRFAAQALERMGADHAGAAEAVAAEVRALLLRLPGLPDLRFANDQPLAGPETKNWIRERVLAGGEGGGGGAPAPGGDGPDDPVAAVRDEAIQLARQKKLPEALGRLAGEARRAPRLRDRVRFELEAARICMEHGHHETALAQLEGLDDEVRRAAIEAWDPDVAAQVLRTLIAARQRAGARGPEDAQRLRELLGRLSRLDVVAALELGGKK